MNSSNVKMAQSAGAAEYITPTALLQKDKIPHPTNECPDMTLNNLMVMP